MSERVFNIDAFSELLHVSNNTANGVATLNKWVKCIADHASTLDRRLTDQEDLLEAKCVEPRPAAESGIFGERPSADEEQKQAPKNSMQFGVDLNDMHSNQGQENVESVPKQQDIREKKLPEMTALEKEVIKLLEEDLPEPESD